MIIEIIATTLKDAIEAEKYGANRIELVMGINEGGLTPSYSTIKTVIENVNIPVHVMIRPHSRSFLYDQYDEMVILEDISICKKLGADGIVFGALTKAREIDEQLLKKVIEASAGMNITFHRAIDETIDILKATNTIIQYPEITHILTSGGRNSVLDAVENIKEMIQITKQSKVKLIAGSGLTLNKVSDFIKDTKVNEVHFGSGVRLNQSAIELIDKNKMDTLIQQIKAY